MIINSDLIDRLESLRIDIDIECMYCDPTGNLRREYIRANEMLDDCIAIVKEEMSCH